MKKFILLGLAVAACATTASANCPTVLADAAKGNYPNQYDLQEFETAHNCKLNFSGNPDAAALKISELPVIRDCLTSIRGFPANHS